MQRRLLPISLANFLSFIFSLNRNFSSNGSMACSSFTMSCYCIGCLVLQLIFWGYNRKLTLGAFYCHKLVIPCNIFLSSLLSHRFAASGLTKTRCMGFLSFWLIYTLRSIENFLSHAFLLLLFFAKISVLSYTDSAIFNGFCRAAADTGHAVRTVFSPDRFVVFLFYIVQRT